MSAKRINNKLLLFILLLIVVFALFLVRLFDVQLVRGDEFYDLSEENRYFNKREKAERAVFLDRYGDPLVLNKKEYLEILEPDQLYSEKKLLENNQALALLATDSARVSHDFSRDYLYGAAMSSSLGYLSSVTADDLAEDASLTLDERLGRMGLESYFDQIMRSQAAHKKYEVNALGEKQRLVEFDEASFGKNIQTSLDPYLSSVAYQAMAGKKGAVVIMDANTGELLSLISSPSYDANVFEASFLEKLKNPNSRVVGQSSQQIQAYLEDERQLFFNRSISGAYPPGSVFKLVTALAALEEEALDENTIVEDEGVLKVGDWEYANWYYTQYGRTEGSVDLVKAIARSNDIYFYKAAEWLGPTKLAEYANLLSFGEKIGVELNGEATGLVPNPSWKEEFLAEPWYLGNTYHFGIGQGDLMVTPLQVAQMTQAIVNQGTLCPGTLLSAKNFNCRDLNFAEENLDLVLEGMLAACSSGGTAYPLFAYNQEQEVNLGFVRDGGELSEKGADLSVEDKIKAGMIACKTGTAEFGGADERGYRKTHAWLTGVVGIDLENLGVLIKGEGENKNDGELGKENLEIDVEENSATDSANLSENDLQNLRQQWLEKLERGNFPEEIVITVLVESDDEKAYREGSDDAAPVVAAILDWMRGE